MKKNASFTSVRGEELGTVSPGFGCLFFLYLLLATQEAANASSRTNPGKDSLKCLVCYLMEGEITESMPIPEESDDSHGRITSNSLDSILPDDLLEKVLSFLPIVSIIRSSSVCKRWHEAVRSGNLSWAAMSPQKPWYFMFTCSDDRVAGFTYDPTLRKWYTFDFPCIQGSNWATSSSCGLVCFMDGENNRIFVCNPITRGRMRLHDAPGGEFPDYTALAMAVDRGSQSYLVAVVKCKQVPQDYYQWDLSIHIYESETRAWVTSLRQVLVGWRGGDESVICDGVLYLLIYSTGVRGNAEPSHCLVMYDLSTRSSSHASLMRMSVPVPCSLTCGRLMNLKDRLVLVGGIGKHDRPGIIKGIGIWELREKEWQEVARMPHKFFQGFGEFDDVFASSGTDDLIYIQSFGSPQLLTFDMSLKLWKWSVKSPLTKRFPLQLFTGFCFEPRLEITP